MIKKNLLTILLVFVLSGCVFGQTKPHRSQITGMEKLSANDFGAKPVPGFDNTSAIVAALAAWPTAPAKGALTFTPGIYEVTGDIAVFLKKGVFDGNGSTFLLTQNASAVFTITSDELTFQNVTVTKATDTIVCDTGIRVVGGIRNRFDNLRIYGTFANGIRFVGLRESNVSRIRTELKAGELLGNSITLDYCVNNTFTSLDLRHAFRGIYITSTIHPTLGHKSEGISISSSIILKTAEAIRADSATALFVTNCILDFCRDFGVVMTLGGGNIISENWISDDGSSTTFRGVWASELLSGLKVLNNFFVGQVASTNSKALFINSKSAVIHGNTLATSNIALGNWVSSANTIQGNINIVSASGIAPVTTTTVRNLATETPGVYPTLAEWKFATTNINDEENLGQGAGFAAIRGTSIDQIGLRFRTCVGANRRDALIITPLGYIVMGDVLSLADNDAAIAAGLATGTVYRTGDYLKIVH